MRLTWLLAGMAALCPDVARADFLQSTREQPLVEVSHNVDITIDNGVATYKVRRVFSNPGKVADQAGLAIDLPYGSAATGLRIRAHDKWYDGELMERDKAAALYHEMTGYGAYRPKDPALLQWLWADKLYLQVFPVMPGEASTVEYTLTAPTRYEGGRYWVSYPRIDTQAAKATLALATPVVTVHTAWGGAVTIDGKRSPDGTSVVLDVPPRPDWADVIGADTSSASYVASSIEVPASSHTDGTFDHAKVKLDISHTYQSDLRVELVTPQGKSVVLHDRTGGTKNDVKGELTVQLPPGTTGAGTWRLVVSDHAALDTGTIDAWRLELGDDTVESLGSPEARSGAEGRRGASIDAADTPVFIPDAPENPGDAGVAAIAITPPAIATWAVRFGRVVASDTHAYARVEIDAAPLIAPLPKRAQVVFALDASYTMRDDGVAAQIAIIRAYLTHVPDAEVEIVAYRRHASRVFGAFVPAKEADARLAKMSIALGNGSALDEACRLASQLLADRSGPRRLVLLTDEMLRTGAAPDLSTLPKDVVVHAVHPQRDQDDRASVTRRDDATYASLATKHHGLFYDVGGTDAKDLPQAVLELVRPTRVEHFAIDGVDHGVLREGTSVREMTLASTAPKRVVVTGTLWSDPVRADIVADDKFSRQTAAFVFGADEYSELSPEEMMTVAMYGRAVSPVTSYVAAEPGTRPSTVGFGSIGHGSGSGSGAGYGSGYGGLGRMAKRDLGALVDASTCIATQPPASVRLTVETTLDEIVDVTGADSPLASCIAEVVWNVRLTPAFYDERETFTLVY